MTCKESNKINFRFSSIHFPELARHTRYTLVVASQDILMDWGFALFELSSDDCRILTLRNSRPQ